MIVVHVVLKLTRLGRRFELVGENPRSAANIGIGTRGYVISAYWLSTLLGATTGVLLAGLLRLPTLTAGNDYLLPSIAAVVLGGTALTGGKGSLVGTALGALFLAQLGQLVSDLHAGHGRAEHRPGADHRRRDRRPAPAGRLLREAADASSGGPQ